MKGFYRISKQGLLEMESSEKLPHHKPENSFFEHPVLVALILILCSLADLAMFYNLFSNVLYDSVELRILAVLGLIITFDIAPVYLGIVYKRKNQGYKVSIFVLILLFAVFITGIIINFWLRWQFKSDVLPLIDSTASPEMIEKKQSVFAIFGAFLPVFTSVVSFGVSYITTDFLRKRYRQLTRSRLILVEKLRKLNEILEEYKNDEDFYERELGADTMMYKFFRRKIIQQANTYYEHVRVEIAKHLLNPTATNVLSERDRAQMNDILLSDDFNNKLEERLASEEEAFLLPTSTHSDSKGSWNQSDLEFQSEED